MEQENGSILKGFLWMVVLSMLLCWLPVLGQFIAGFVGGRKAGGVARAIIAFILPAIILTVFVIVIGPGLPFLGPIIGGVLSIAAVAVNFSLFCGAIVGGAISK